MINDNTIVNVTGLRKSFGNRSIIEGLTFSAERNKVFGIIGPNGAGKTTTLRILSGIIRHYDGDVKILDLTPDEARKQGYISYMPEDSFPYDRLTGIENLEFYANIYAKSHKQAREFVERGIKIADLGDRIYDKTSEYSRGMKRRLIIARTLMVSPKIAILDEPTSSLDVESAVMVRNTISSMKNETTIILSSHNMLEVEYLCDYILLLDKGKALRFGKPSDIIREMDVRNLEEAFLLLTGEGK
ncbi:MULTISPECIES: ABC transporter ATP-binding protein [Acidianus]|uniref:Multidrug ABC transporter ATP-binding protein n=1 Tax=Candidatus Acidianus copahuensis TaxID=1160895 RepID=A0A031LTI0_9CREN|nr:MULTISPECIES: ABC transporter ATP-binding protein [Acidianus]EZQ10814.1 multidrug ABC transporter ATP-binding protein [Candidatus Acidianus copahuensis]NON62867.1 ABC transporter ATP-binding protein [Acidianus sp. RZ1]